MCTYSFSRSEDGRRIISMNRDEARERHEGAFSHHKADTPQLLYPTDERSGGTWFGCNSQGLCLALLNRYQCENPYASLSRGLLIPRFLSNWDSAAKLKQLTRDELLAYPPFDMIASDHQACFQLTWDGDSVQVVHHTIKDFSFSSSALNTDVVLAKRQSQFRTLLDQNKLSTTDSLLRAKQILTYFHLVSDPSHSEQGVLMDRPEAHTKSICQVIIDGHALSFRYLDEQCLASFRTMPQLKEKNDNYGLMVECVATAKPLSN
ncbi:hypothetical protein DBZ36_16750 [Alginatibacterium sediminis]|uniref:NRDE family protein n=1 Tax=Alginatibacterium sediminis TaxID=2164068 RepID=A0A420E6Z7_9ALTE|nr:NRDE family protein [Alginatibacterium sediminis]RKF14311.1 hypothetical protein DBZ36_16750 [Alginatibacterium sediminis]